MNVSPIDVRKQSESLQFFTILNAMLAYMPVLEEEKDLRSRFAEIGIIPGAPFEPADEQTRMPLSPACARDWAQCMPAPRPSAARLRSLAALSSSRTIMSAAP